MSYVYLQIIQCSILETFFLKFDQFSNPTHYAYIMYSNPPGNIARARKGGQSTPTSWNVRDYQVGNLYL